ncbi:MAG: hypothetical protein ACQEUZ_02380 [Pseudomonadota bacterium]
MSGEPPSDALARKVRFLSDPAAYAHAPARVERRETHMSWVFLAGDEVFKLKKPVALPHLDFRNLADRARATHDEVRLNRRLAPEVYVGAVALRRSDGGFALDGEGEIVDWLVHMRRLPEAATLERIAREGGACPRRLAPLTERLVAFYRAAAPCGPPPRVYADRYGAEHGRTAEVLRDPALGLDPELAETAITAFGVAYDRARPLLEARAGRVVEGHGDLRPEHVFLTDPPVVIDCLEFSRDLRLVDPFEEIVFLGLECARLGADHVFPLLRAALEEGLEDRPPDALLAFHWRYRCLLRARLSLLHLSEPNPREPDKWLPLTRRYLELAAEAGLRTARSSDPRPTPAR